MLRVKLAMVVKAESQVIVSSPVAIVRVDVLSRVGLPIQLPESDKLSVELSLHVKLASVAVE